MVVVRDARARPLNLRPALGAHFRNGAASAAALQTEVMRTVSGLAHATRLQTRPMEALAVAVLHLATAVHVFTASGNGATGVYAIQGSSSRGILWSTGRPKTEAPHVKLIHRGSCVATV